jgi:ABC-type glycerol-3-phosphate transport system permease component
MCRMQKMETSLTALTRVLGSGITRPERPDCAANEQDAGLIIATRPVLTFLILSQRTITQGLTATAVKGQSC